MGKILGPLFSTFGNRAIGAVVAGAANYAATKWGFSLDPATRTAATLFIYGLTHTALDKLDKSKGGTTAAPAPTAG